MPIAEERDIEEVSLPGILCSLLGVGDMGVEGVEGVGRMRAIWPREEHEQDLSCYLYLVVLLFSSTPPNLQRTG